MSRTTRMGFTLVEVMIAVAIIGILAGFAAPSLLASMPTLRVNGAARQVLSDLRFARTQAVERGVPVVVKFNVSSSGGASAGTYVLALDNNLDNNFSSADTVITETRLPEDYPNVEFASNNAPSGIDLSNAALNDVADAITFRLNGAASENGNVYVRPVNDSNGSKNRRVRILAATGNVRIESWNGTTWE